jgi:hypothetical protein
MKNTLNGWQRAWVALSIILFILSIAIATLLWPHREPGVVSDIFSPECKSWLILPEGFIPSQSPESGQICYRLHSLLFLEHINLHSLDEYDRHIQQGRMKIATATIGLWIGFSLLIYVTGWAIGWIRRGFATGNIAPATLPVDQIGVKPSVNPTPNNPTSAPRNH